MMMMYWVEILADTGPDFFGPFPTFAEAAEWRKTNGTESAMISELESPEEDDDE
jgi:hypothetical protein